MYLRRGDRGRGGACAVGKGAAPLPAQPMAGVIPDPGYRYAACVSHLWACRAHALHVWECRNAHQGVPSKPRSVMGSFFGSKNTARPKSLARGRDQEWLLSSFGGVGLCSREPPATSEDSLLPPPATVSHPPRALMGESSASVNSMKLPGCRGRGGENEAASTSSQEQMVGHMHPCPAETCHESPSGGRSGGKGLP